MALRFKGHDAHPEGHLVICPEGILVPGTILKGLGEMRERQLLAAYPQCFEVVKKPKKRRAMSRAMKSPTDED